MANIFEIPQPEKKLIERADQALASKNKSSG